MYVHKMSADGGSTFAPVAGSLYGECTTAAGTAAKVVTCADFDAYRTGVTLFVKFTNSNTAASPTLNVNSKGAKAIYYRGAAMAANKIAAGGTYQFRYNGTQWDYIGDVDTDTNTQTITGVKGNAESSYRTGNVNLTAANIGAKPTHTAKSSPSASGNATAFIDTISQAADGVITATKKNIPTMGAATASAAGTAGLVPAPAAGKHLNYLRADGVWESPPGSKLIVAELDSVTNTSGSYTHTSTVEGVTGDMKPVMIEGSDLSIFGGTITITTSTDSVTLSCDSVSGTSTVKVSMMLYGNANAGATAITTQEFDILASRIGTLTSLTTTNKNSLVEAVNELSASSMTVYVSQEYGGMQLYRFGAVRMLSITFVPYSTVHSITLPESDRPTRIVRGTGVRQVSNGSYASLSYVDIGINGSIVAAKFDGYNTENGASYLGDSDMLSCTITWIRA